MQVELGSHLSRDFQRFETEIMKVEGVMACWAVGGGFDYLVQFMVRDIDHYQRIVDELLAAEIGLRRYYTYVVTRCVGQRQELPEFLLERLGRIIRSQFCIV
ncbi:MAG: Lrp/AsnC ligand binding domain-containing protein [Thiolinea sp.]